MSRADGITLETWQKLAYGEPLTAAQQSSARTDLAIDPVISGNPWQGETLTSTQPGSWLVNDVATGSTGSTFVIPLSAEIGSVIRRGTATVTVADPLAAYPWALRLQTQQGTTTKGTSVAVGQPVTEWVDDLGSSELLAIGEASHIPTLATSNGKRVINFDNNSAFTIPVDLTLTGATYFAAVKFDVASGNHGLLNATGFTSFFQFVSSTQMQVRTESNVLATLNLPTPINIGGWVIIELVISGSNATVYVNGIAGSTANVGGNVFKVNRLGRASTNYFQGKCAAMLLYNGVMADADRAVVRKYLKQFRTTEYYASTTGNDSNDGWSAAAPVATLLKLNSLPIFPGDKLLLKRGDEWREKFEYLPTWTNGERVSIEPYGTGNKPKLLGSRLETAWELVGGTVYRAPFTDSPSYDYGTEVARPRNAFWVKNADLAEANVAKLIRATGSNAPASGEYNRIGNYLHINIGQDPNGQRIEVPRNNEAGLRMATGIAPLLDIRNFHILFFDLNQYTSTAGDILLEDSDVYWGAEDGISPGGTGKLTVRRCRVIRNGNIRTLLNGAGDGISAHFQMELVVEDCEVRDNEKGGINNLKDVLATIRRNYVTGNNMNMNILESVNPGRLHRFESNLIIVQSKDSGNGIRRDGSSNDAIVEAVNNTIVGVKAAGSTGINAASIAKNNIVSGFQNGIRTSTTVDHNDVFNCDTPYDITPGAGSLTSDPKFSNSGGGNYTTLPGSPCRQAGIAAGVTLNIKGQPFTSPPNIGAY